MSKNISPVWHPFTQHAILPDSLHIDRAKGVTLYTKDGQSIIDGVSSWWINIHGHCHTEIVEAVQDQAGKLDQVIFAGFTHEPAEALAEKLLSITVPELEYVFYSDSGSTSIEVALKMAVGYWNNIGKARTKIVALEQGYHGGTFGSMSAGSRGVYSAAYQPLLFDVMHLPCPGLGDEQATIDAFEKILKDNKDEIAALILEPLVQGAGGMLMYSPETLKALDDLCKLHNVFLIADEVMTGWGRTGTRFAHEQAGIAPDIVCFSKSLTNGMLPLGVTMTTREIYKGFYFEDRGKTFFHSTSYTANPLACAAALKSIELWDEEPVFERIESIKKYHTKALQKFENRRDVMNIRQTGTIAALDIVTDETGYLSHLAPNLYKFFLKRGLLLRPLGNTLYILPPYCIQEEELQELYNGIESALDFVRDGSKKQAA